MLEHSITVRITEEQFNFVESSIESGQYKNASELMRVGLECLIDRAKVKAHMDLSDQIETEINKPTLWDSFRDMLFG